MPKVTDWIHREARLGIDLVDHHDKTIAAHKLVGLLTRIEAGLSLNRAAQECGYSYRHAWGLIQEAEARCGTELLNRQVGGAGGGGSELSPAGKQVLCQLSLLYERVKRVTQTQDGRRAGSKEPRVLFLAGTLEAVETGVVTALADACLNDIGVRLGHVAAGSGTALQIAKGGRVDLVLTHAPQLEQVFVEQGWGVPGFTLMRSHYVIVGPDSDPAGVGHSCGQLDPPSAFAAIAASTAPFISRGDNSGTHIREQALWRAAGTHPRPESYIEIGSGNQAVISLAAATGGYALVDEAGIRRFGLPPGLSTLYRDERNTSHLENRYSLTAVRSERKIDSDTDDATHAFLEWIHERGADVIGAAVSPKDGLPMFEAALD